MLIYNFKKLILFILLLLSTSATMFAATVDGDLEREGRACSEKTSTGVVAEDTGGWAVISGGGEAFYYFYIPYTAREDLTQLYLYWYGQRVDVLGQGAVIEVYNNSSGQWIQIAIDNSTTEDWRGSFAISSSYLSVVNGSSRVLKVKFDTGTLDSYRLRTVRLNFSYTDHDRTQGDLEAAYACSLATIETDRFSWMIREYDLWEGDPLVDGELFWMWAASVYQFARHLQAVDIQSLIDLKNLPSGIQGLYEDIFDLGLFHVVGVIKLEFDYAITCGGPEPSSFTSYISHLDSKFNEATRRLGGFDSAAGITREDCFENLYQTLVICSDSPVQYFKDKGAVSFSNHANWWRQCWNLAANNTLPGEEGIRDMGYKAAKTGQIMEEFANAWQSSFATIQVMTDPSGIDVLVNGNIYTTPKTWHWIKGVSHAIGAYSQVTHNGYSYHFTGWSDGGAQIHTVAPIANITYVAQYAIDTGSLQVIISPQAAIDAGAQWKLTTESTWHNSGYILPGIPTGSVTVEYKNITGWTKPANEVLAISKDQTTTTTGTYIQQIGSLQITILPPGVVTAGAQWRVDSGTWRNSGYTQTGLSVGSHTVEYKDVTGWDTPADETVQINDGLTTTTSGTYIQQTGSLQVTISPQTAIDAGAQWRVDSGTWRDSGYTESSLTVGSHTVEYKDITSWSTPANEAVQINDGLTTTTSGTYIQIGPVQVAGDPIDGYNGLGTDIVQVLMGDSILAAINWGSLDNLPNQELHFLKDSGNFAVLNRIIGLGGATQFHGVLGAFSGDFLNVNTRGIVFGPESYIQTRYFVASGIDIKNLNFMDGIYQFEAFPSTEGHPYSDQIESVTNEGTGTGQGIHAENVALIGKNVFNRGTISTTAPDGAIVMAAGKSVYLSEVGSNVAVDFFDVSLFDSHVVDNDVKITTGGKVTLAAGDIYSTALDVGSLAATAKEDVTMEGDITASSHVEILGGQKGGYDSSADIHINGSITAGSMRIKNGKDVVPGEEGLSGIYVADGKNLTATDGDVVVEAVHDIVLGGDVVATGDVFINGDEDGYGDPKGVNYNPRSYGGGDVIANNITDGGKVDVKGNAIQLNGDVSANGGDLTITGRTSRDTGSEGGLDVEWGYIDIAEGKTLYASHNVILKDAFGSGGDAPPDGEMDLTGHGSLEIEAEGGSIQTQGPFGEGVKITVEDLTSSSLWMTQADPLNLVDYSFGNQNKTALYLRSINGSVAAVDSNYQLPSGDGKNENAADQWASITAQAYTDITLQGHDTSRDITAGALTSTGADFDTGNITITSDNRKVLLTQDVSADQGSVAITAIVPDNGGIVSSGDIEASDGIALFGVVTVDASIDQTFDAGQGTLWAKDTLSTITKTETGGLSLGGNTLVNLDGIDGSTGDSLWVKDGFLTITDSVDVEGNLKARGVIHLQGTTNNVASDILSTGSGIIFDHDVIADGVGSQVFDAGSGQLTAENSADIDKITVGSLTLTGDAGIELGGNVDTHDGDLTFEDAVTAKGTGNQVFDADGAGKDLIAHDDIIKNTAGNLTLGAGQPDAQIELSGDVTITDGHLIFWDKVIANGTGNQRFDTDGGTLTADGTITKTTAGDLYLGGDGDVDLNGTVEVENGNFVSSGIDFDNTGAAIITLDGDITINHTGIVTLGADLDSNGGILSGTATKVIVTPNGKIQDAIDIAVDGAEIVVQPSIYTGEGNRDIDFRGKAITVRGATGDANDCIIDCQGTKGQSHRGFKFVRGEDSNSVLEGFTITNGYGPEEDIWGIGRLYSAGGGIYCMDSSPTISNCTIVENSAGGYGGGMLNKGGRPILTNCTFSNNTAESGGHGGGMLNWYGSPTSANCTFSSNTAGGTGGGMYNQGGSPKTMNCTFRGNSANNGGGVYIQDFSNSVLVDCTFTDNSAAYKGGGLSSESEGSPSTINLTLSKCMFSGNSATHGGGMNNFNCSPILTNCTFIGNTTTGRGGGIYNTFSSPKINNGTFSGNSATTGGGIYNSSNSGSNLFNCILWDNIPEQIYGDTPRVTYSDVQGGQNGIYDPCNAFIWDPSNIAADPCFVSPGYWADVNDPNIVVEPNDPNAVWIEGDYHLLSDSPCIDAGDANYIGEPNETDLDGNPRVIGTRIDMGAYEFQNQFFVDNDAPNDPAPNNPSISDPCEDGSWEHPFDDIQEAINVAADGYIVTVLQGTYTGIGNHFIDFRGKALILRSENGPNTCIIDCQQQGNGFYFHNGEGSNSVLDGLTITNGLSMIDEGGGIGCYESSPTIKNCNIIGNCAQPSADGGGIRLVRSNAKIMNCVVTNNIASYGGGISCSGSPTIVNCTFSNNSSVWSGGGFYGYGSNSTLINCIFSGNSANQGEGGGVYYSDGTLILTRCRLNRNSAGEWGGAMYCYRATVRLTNCILTSNWTNIFDDHGGGGGVYCQGEKSDSIVVDGCLIAGNYSASHGGGLLSETNNSVITSCTITGNYSEENGGAILSNSETLQIVNSIFWENSAGLLGSSIYVGGGFELGPGVLNISYSDIQSGQTSVHGTPGSTVVWGTGNIDVEPLFINPGYWDLWNWVEGDYHLLPESQCINAGDPNYPVDTNDIDLDGNPRIIGGRIDMGAYEYSPERFPDLNGDRIVNFVDYAILVNYWMNDICEEPDWCEGRDLNESGAVDFDDIAIFVEYWLEEYPVQFYSNSLDTDPRWATTGEWAYGQPAGNGGIEYGNPDPTTGYTETNVYGVNLNGDYSTAVGGPYYVTAGPFDCSGYRDVRLKFARWLNTDDPEYVKSTVEVSYDGSNWFIFWEHNRRPAITDSTWRIVDYDISSLTDGQETVYIRWGYEILQNAYPYSGWNIDDIALWGNPKIE